jgi:hypothetical protein
MIQTSEFSASEPPEKAATWNIPWATLWTVVLGLLVLSWAFGNLKRRGTFDGFLVPELKVSCRPALLGPGYVLQIVNASHKPLFNLRVTSSDWTRSYPITSQLDSGSLAEAGWLQLPAGIQLGHTYQIEAEGYLLARSVTLPDR